MEKVEHSTVRLLRKSHTTTTTRSHHSSTVGGDGRSLAKDAATGGSNGRSLAKDASTGDNNGRSLAEDSSASGAFHRANTKTGDFSPTYDPNVDQSLESRGIRIVDTNIPNFSNVSPEQVSDYYKSLGDWQNLLPKTDYSYSPVSRFYTKKINGVIPVVPNMSRRFIWRNAERLDNEINTFRSESMLYEKTTFKKTPGGAAKAARFASSAKTASATSATARIAGVLSVATRTVNAYTRRTYWSILRRFQSRHLERKTYFESNFWKILLLALFGLLVCWLVAHPPRWYDPNLVDAGAALVGESFSKPLSLILNLVLSVYELTYSSVTFVASAISNSSRCASEAASFAGVAVVRSLLSPFWSVPNRVEIRPTGVDQSEVERLVRLLANTDELVKTIVASPELAKFVEEKVQRARAEGDQKLAAAKETYDGRNTVFEKRLSELEEKLSRANLAEENLLKERVESLREEIRTREKRIEREVVVLLATAAGLQPGDDADQLRNKFASLFESVELAHRKIENLRAEFQKYATNASRNFESIFESSKDELKHDLRLSVDEMVSRKLGEWTHETTAATAGDFQNLQLFVQEVVQKALDKYDADKTGLADYALESSGGTILSTRCTETKATNAQFSIFGIPLWHTSRSPRTVIQPGVHPGECWAFPGSTGYLVIQLAERIKVTGFTVEHIPRALAPNGTIDSAPRDFSVWALRWETDPEPKPLGRFRFDVDGPSLQFFEANKLDEPFQIVELKILSNHGKIDYTCLYRFRVHGRPV